MARLKEIIRVGGENVAPAEVEQALREETGLKLISVVGVPDERLGEVAAAIALASDNVDWPAGSRQAPVAARWIQDAAAGLRHRCDADDGHQ